MRRSARTDLCGGRSAMLVPTASGGEGLSAEVGPKLCLSRTPGLKRLAVLLVVRDVGAGVLVTAIGSQHEDLLRRFL
jgi:hypothetical protein